MHRVLMHKVLRLFVTALAVVALACVGGMVSAQTPAEQIKLSDKQIESFIAAHKEMVKTFEKMAAETSEEEAEKQLDSVARKFGFKDQNEYEQVVTTIDMVIFGLDPQTKAFTEPPARVRKDIEAAMADKSLSEEERKQLVAELNELLQITQPIAHPSNIELVKRYYDQVAPLLQ